MGYARFRHWRLYGEEGLAGREAAALWLAAESLTVEHRGHPLSRYNIAYESGGKGLADVTRPRLFGNPYALPQPRLFDLGVLGKAGWLKKALKLEGVRSQEAWTVAGPTGDPVPLLGRMGIAASPS